MTDVAPTRTAQDGIDVSVIVPCYNTEAFLDQALSSLEANDRCSLEVIVVNDGSTDGSLAIMREHEARDPRVRVIDKENSGYGANMNRGISEARGTYVGILEPDDYLRPHMFDVMFECAERHGLPDMVKTPYIRVWMPTTPQEHLYMCSYYGRIKPEDEPFTLADCPRLIQHHPSIWSAIYRRDFLTQNDIRFMEVPGAGWVDNPFLIQTCVLAKSIVYINEPFYCYREDLPGSSSVLRKAGLSFERWNDMADVIDRCGVTDEGILRSFYVIGFRYAGAAIDEFGLEIPEVREWISQMFRRMDPKVVASIVTLSGSFKRTYFRLSGYEPVPFSDLPYLRSLVGEFFYSWCTNGPAFALSRLGIFARRRAAEKGLVKPTSTHSASI
ncbi:glycosyltransferase family 2 protein [Olsenella phocaeensis]|uniref:glycosyltransferase family 2 protein n=1 Tax=Olsenella phocaeensis TaxID=1852385 RepID=UPI0009319345|nr:glycosyltransferase [Olsenella phocaeensis]